MNVYKLGAALVAGALALGAVHGPAFAASPTTQVFLDNLIPNVDFLDRSSRFALTNSKNPRIRDFAQAEAKEQTLAANAVYDWTEARKKVLVASNDNPDRLMTGRSVATDAQPATIVDNRLPRGQEDLDSLEGLTGKTFDEDYKAKQLDALTQVQTDYQDYIAKGDDPVLLGIANRELPKVRRRIATLAKM